MEHNLLKTNQIDVEGRGEKPINDVVRRGEKPKDAESERGELPGSSAQPELDLSDSDTSSLMSVSSCASNLARDDRGRFYRKRPLKDVHPDDDSGDKTVARSNTVAKRGRGRPPTTGQYVGLHKAKKEAEEALRAERRAEEEAKQLAAEDRRVLQVALTRMRTLSGASTTTSEREKDAEDCTATELRSKLEEAASRIKDVVKQSKGLKGINQKTLKDAATAITEIAEAFAERTASDEVRMLRAENTRLARRMADMQAEQEAMRADLASLRLERMRDPPTTGAAQQETELSRVLKELASLNARFSIMEGRILRPPLQSSTTGSYAAAVRKDAATRTMPAPTSAAPRPAPTPQTLAQKPTKGKKKTAVTSTPAQSTAPSTSAVATTTAAPKSAPSRNSGEWETVGAKKKAARQRRRAADKKRKAEKKLRAPRSTAVVITLHPDAAEKGASYGEILKKARAEISLEELQIQGLKIKETRTGARLLEVPGATSGAKADALAEKLRASLDATVVKVSRPTKCADLRISGLDDSVTTEEVAAAVAKAAECTPTEVKSGTIRRDIHGLGTVIVSCPVAAARKVAEGRRVLVGWVSAQAKLLQPLPTRCFRCLSAGHVGVKCTASTDYSTRCYRCSQPGHKAGTCEAPPHCFICAAAGKSSEHRIGSKSCADQGGKKKKEGTSKKSAPRTKTREEGAVKQPAPKPAGEVPMDQ